jgi:hypothetical protein
MPMGMLIREKNYLEEKATYAMRKPARIVA